MTQPPMTPNYRSIPPQPGGGLATAALVVGIVAVCLAVIVFCVPPLGGLLGVLAIVLGAISMSQSPSAGKGRAGLILGVIAVLISGGVFMGMRWFGHKVQQNAQTWSQQIQDAAKKEQEQIQKAQQQAQQQQEEYQRAHSGATTQPAAP